MAEETKNKVFYQGQEYDQDALDFIGQNAEAYARHQNLNDVQRNAFMQEVNARLANMRGGGDGSLSDNNSIVYTGAFTGSQKKGPKAWNGITRNGFSPRDLADSYLMGGFGKYNSLTAKRRAAEEAKAKEDAESKVLAWKAHTGNGDSTLGSRLRKLWGNDLDMTHWADSAGDVLVDGTRSRNGRYNQLNALLKEYRDDLTNGKYGKTEDNEEMQNELSLLNGVLDNADVSQLDSAYARLLGNELYDKLMFTGEKYMTPEDLTKSEQDTRLQQAKDYENGVEGVKNPYQEGTPEYDALERRRQHADDLKFNESFGNNTNWQEGDSDYTYTADLTDSLDQNLFQGWQGSDMRANLDAMYGKDYDQHGRDVAVGLGFEFGHNDYSGWKDEFFNREDESLEGTMYKNYLDVLKDTTDQGADDTFFALGKKNARSTNAIKAKAAMDWARALVSQPKYQQMQYDDGYIIPELIDWNSGKAYVFSFNGTQGRAKRVNLKSILPKIDKNSMLYKTLLNEYRVRNNRAAMKNGGVLKAAQGAPLSAEEMQFLQSPQGQSSSYVDPFYNTNYQGFNGIQQSPEERIALENARYEEAQQNGVGKQDLIDRNKSTEFNARDWARIGTAIADLTGAVISLSGFTPVGAAIGAGSTLTQFGLDIADHDVGFTDALKFLGAGLALDALSLVPGVGGFGKVAKAAKSLSKYAVPIISALQVAGNSPEAIATAKKVFNGDFKGITVGEWKGFARALNGLTNVTPMAHIAYSKRWGQLSKVKTPEAQTWKFKVGDNKEVTLNQEQISKINSSKDPVAELRAAFTGENALTEADDVSHLLNQPGFIKSKFGIKPSLDVNQGQGVVTSEAYKNYIGKLRALQRKRNINIANGNRADASIWAKAKGKMSEYGLDDAAYALGGSNPRDLINVLKGKPASGKDGLTQTLRSAQTTLSKLQNDEATQQLEALNRLLESNNLKPSDQAKLTEQRNRLQQALSQARSDWNANGGTNGLNTLEEQVKTAETLKNLRIAREGNLNNLRNVEAELTAKGTFAIDAADKAAIKAANDKLATLSAELNKQKVAASKAASLATAPGITARQKAARMKRLTKIMDDINNKTTEIDKAKQELQIATKSVSEKRRVHNIEKGKIQSQIDKLTQNETRLVNHIYSNDLIGKAGINPNGRNITDILADVENVQSVANAKIQKMHDIIKFRSRARGLKKGLDARQKMVTNIADPIFEQAVLNNSGEAVRDQAAFQRFIQALVDKGYSERDILRILKINNDKAEYLSQLRALYGFRHGGSIPKFNFGGATQTSNAQVFADFAKKAGNFVGSNAITGLEIGKNADAIRRSKAATQELLDVPALQLSYTPQMYKLNTSLLDSAYRTAADKIRSAGNEASNNYSTAETQLAGKLATEKNAADYDVQGANALTQNLVQMQAKQQEIENANNKAFDALNNQNAQLRNSKMLSDANNRGSLTQYIGNIGQTYIQNMQRGIAESRNKNRLAKISQMVMDNPEYKQAYSDYMEAYNAYKENPNDSEAKEAANTASKHLKTVRTNLTSQLTMRYPEQPTNPFSYVRGVTPYTGEFWDNVTLNKEGGTLGKLTQAELVKLFRQRQSDARKEKESYLKQLNQYAERANKGKVSPAYLAYLKLVNSKL